MTRMTYLKERTTLRTLVVALIVLVLGIGLLIFSESRYVRDTDWLHSVVGNLGGVLIAAISIASLWELFSKRAFLDELLAKAGLAEDIRSLGLVGFTVEPLSGPNFKRLIASTNSLDMFVCYANTWRASYEADLVTLAQKKEARVRLLVPNPRNDALMDELAHRFQLSNREDLIRKIEAAEREFKSIFTGYGKKADYSVWHHDETPVHSYYRFDGAAVVTLYKHSRGRGAVPTFVAQPGGSLYEWVQTEVDSMTVGVGDSPALARRVYPDEAE